MKRVKVSWKENEFRLSTMNGVNAASSVLEQHKKNSDEQKSAASMLSNLPKSDAEITTAWLQERSQKTSGGNQINILDTGKWSAGNRRSKKKGSLVQQSTASSELQGTSKTEKRTV
jgi:hypothetical protein